MLPTLGTQKPTSSAQPKQALPVVGEWNHQTAEKNPQGKPLPSNAVAWKPDGNPYFGDGILGKIKEYTWMFTRDIQGPSTQDWEIIKEKWNAASSLENKPALPGESSERAVARSQVAGEAVSAAWQAGSADGSVVSPILRGVSIGVKALTDLFSLPSQVTEQALGAVQGALETGEEIDSPLWQLDESPFTKWIENTPIAPAYKMARIALSPSANKWSVLQKNIEEGWQAGRILYSQAFDATLKEEYLRRYRAGENPELLALELQNPLAELGGQLIADPLNFVGLVFKGAQAASEIEKGFDAVRATGIFSDTDAIKAFEIANKTTDEAEALRSWAIVDAAQVKRIETVRGSRLLNNDFTVNALTQGSRVKLYTQKAQDFTGLLISTLKGEGRSFDDVAEAIRAGVQSVSSDRATRQMGMTALSHLTNPHLWMNDNALTSWTVIGDLVKNEAGLARLMGKKDLAGFATEAAALISRASDNQFPTVAEMKVAAQQTAEALKKGGVVNPRTAEMAKVYNDLSPAVKTLDVMNNILSKPKNWVNSILSMDYFGLRGGTAIKNWASNFEFILLDKGPSAWFKDGKFWSGASMKSYLDDVFGFKPSATGGFDTLTASEGASSWSRKLPGSRLMEAGESAAATRIMAAATRDTLNKIIKPGLALPPVKVLTDLGIPEAMAQKFAKEILQNNGNTGKAIEALRGMYGTGSADKWRHMDHLTGFQEKALQNLDIYDDLINFSRTGGNTPADIEAKFVQYRKVIQTRAAEAVKDGVAVSSDHPALDMISHYDEQVRAGNLDAGSQEVFKAVMEASQQAKNEYLEALNQSVRLVTNQLSKEGKLDIATSIGKEYDPIFKAFMEGGVGTKNTTTEMLFSTRQWSAEISDIKNPSIDQLRDYWYRSGIEGDVPLDLTKKQLLNTLWDQHRGRVSAEWNTYFDTVFQQSEDIVKTLGKYMDSTTLEAGFTRSRDAVSKAQAYRAAVYERGRMVVDGMAVPPPMTNNTMPSIGRSWNENSKGALYMLDDIKNKILADFGKKVPGAWNPVVENALKDYARASEPRIAEAKAIALKIATEQRNFTLLNYGERTYADVAKSYVLPYHFFYSRQYKNILPRVARNPEVVAGYAKYKDFLQGLHADLPDWYKQQVNINPFAGEGVSIAGQQISDENPLAGKELLGIPLDHPLFINLEASVNPLYGLTGTDFTDAQKRVDWFSASVDDIGKFGPSMWAPLQMAMAAFYSAKGQEDAAARWGTRLFPITQEIKTATSFLPFLDKPVELDPAVNLFSDGIDPYERSRVGTALLDWTQQQIASIQSRNDLTPAEKDVLIGDVQAQADTAAWEQSGPVWDAAYKSAVQNRAGTVAGGWLLGVGFKVRSTADVTAQQLFTDMNGLYAVSEDMTPEQYRMKWDELREKYPGMDAVLLARKGGDQRDAAYAYNVFGRLPPGKLDDVLLAVGINQTDISKFYDSKGFTNTEVTWTDTEKQRFMAAVVDLSAMLNIPPDATRQEWTAARNEYTKTQAEIKVALGDDIWDKVSLYFDLKDDNAAKADDFKAQHPEVIEALQAIQDAKVLNPLLSAYYGGLDTVNAYVDGKVRQRLSNKYGETIYDLQTEYYARKVADPRDAKSFLNQHPELKKFWTDKHTWTEEANHQFVALAQKIPAAKGIGIRPDFVPQSGAQESLLAAAQGNTLTVEDYFAPMSPALQQRVIAYWEGGAPLPPAANDELDYLAGRFELYNGDALLRRVGAALTGAPSGPPASGPQLPILGQ